jgi:hypothetical protein
MQKIIFGARREEVTTKRRKLRYDEGYNLTLHQILVWHRRMSSAEYLHALEK